jgi:hypothetical protein
VKNSSREKLLKKLLGAGFVKKGKAYYKYDSGPSLGYIKIEIITDNIIRQTTRHEDGDYGSYIKSEYVTTKKFIDLK